MISQNNYGGDIPIILIATKADLAEADRRQISEARGLNYKKELGARCKHFEEVTTYTDNANTITKLLESRIVPIAKEYSMERAGSQR